MNHEKVKFQKRKRKKRFFFLLPLAFFIITFLTGCVQYDVGVTFDSPNRGEIVQSIKLGERLKSFSNATVEEWLNSIESRARQLQGTTKRVNEQELIVTIPFNNGAELERKYNEFFNPKVKESQPGVSTTESLPKLKSQLILNQGNFFLWERDHLKYDLDLRSLSAISANGNVSVNPGSLVDLEFRLNTPWGARSVAKGEDTISPEVREDGHQLVWKLQPGELNHLEAIFWLPIPLGIGAVIVALFIAVGIFLKYQLNLGRANKSNPPAIPQS